MKSVLIFFALFISTNSFSQTIKVDTLVVKDSLTIMQTVLTPADLKISPDLKTGNIVFKIYYNKNGSIAQEYNSYNPSSNEIVFFYARNYELKKLEMFFKFGETLKPIYAKHDFDQELEIVKLLEHKIFTVNSFSGMSAYRALSETQ